MNVCVLALLCGEEAVERFVEYRTTYSSAQKPNGRMNLSTIGELEKKLKEISNMLQQKSSS